MNFFKYVFIFLLFTFTNSANAAYTCGVDADVILTSTVDDYPPLMCADLGGNNCLVLETHSERLLDNSWRIYAKSTGEGCLSPTNLNPAPTPKEITCTKTACPVSQIDTCPSGYNKGTYNGQLSCVKQQDKVLQCSSDVCSNPDNKACPSGYSRGTFNGQNICTKNDTPEDEEPVEPCEGDQCQSSDQQIIEAINDAEFGISDAIDFMGSITSNGLQGVKDKLNEVLNAINELASNISNGGTGNGGDGTGNGGDGTGGDGEDDGSGVDTTGLDAQVPIQQPQQQQLDSGLFASNAHCPQDNGLNLNFLNHSYSYNFNYQPVCDGLNILSFFLMAFAYLASAYIVVRA